MTGRRARHDREGSRPPARAPRAPSPTALLFALVLSACSAPPTPSFDPDLEATPRDLVQAALAPTPREPLALELELERPAAGAILTDRPETLVSGRVRAPDAARIDVVLVVDTSGSTARPSGADVDGDGIVAGPGRPDPEDSVLAAEIAAARAIVTGVDVQATRVGIVAFSGYRYRDRFSDPRPHRTRSRFSARTEAALTRDVEALDAPLAELLARGPEGMTDMAGALRHALAELAGEGDAASEPDPAARGVVVFFTDGVPTLPDPRRPERNERMVLRAADAAAEAGVRVYSFAIGTEALLRPVAIVEMARRTGGVFTPVRDPAHLEAAVSAIRFDALDALSVRNVTAGAASERLHIGPDGSWRAALPLVPGKNRLRARVSTGGGDQVVERVVHYAPGGAETFEPEALDARVSSPGARGSLGLEGELRQRRVLEILARDRAAVEREVDRRLETLEPPTGD